MSSCCKYVPLHVHSEYSLLQGVASIEELVDQAVVLGYESFALCDINTTSGLVLFQQECRRQGIKPILGLQLQNPDNPEERLLLLAKNRAGYSDLCEFLTRYLRRVDKVQQKNQTSSENQACPEIWQDLVAVSQPLKNSVILSDSLTALQALANSAQRSVLYAELLAQTSAERARARRVYAWAQKEHIPLVAQQEIFFAQAQDYELHRLLRAIATGSSLEDLPESLVSHARAYMLSKENVWHLWKGRQSFLETSATFAEECVDDWQEVGWVLPHWAAEDGSSPEDKLRELAEIGLEKNYRKSPHYQRARELQQKELELICRKGYASYFLTVKKIRDYAGEKFARGYRHFKDTTILRGSAANSILLYNIGASELDPIEYDLYFERFLNEDRQSPPDADIDFGWDERDQVIRWIFEEWGEDHVVVLCTTCRFRWRSAIRETAKAMGYSDEEISDRFQQMTRQNATPQVEWKKPAINTESEDLRWNRVLELASKLEGKAHYLGQHPGGVLISEEPIWRYVSCQRSGGQTNRWITQIDMHNGIEDLGLIKYDILGNGSLSVLRDALEMLAEQNIPNPELYRMEVSTENQRVQELMSRGETRGVFYLESPAQSRLNRKAEVGNFREIGITSSLVRPAGAPFTQTFVERNRQQNRGQKNWEFLHPSLRSILGETHDVLVFQEDILRICVEVAHMSFLEADQVRKMMNSLREGVPGQYEKTAAKFMRGCMEKSNYSKAQALELWERVASFRGFSFCKSHSLSYAQLSYKCAYLKVYFPAEFLAAVISNQHGFYHSGVYLDEARRWGIQILGPDINRSRWKTWGRKYKIRLGFQHLRGENIHALEALLAERQTHGDFADLLDLHKRLPELPDRLVEKLIMCGAMDGFAEKRPVLWEAWLSLQQEQKSSQLNNSLQKSFLTEMCVETDTNAKIQLNQVLRDFSMERKCSDEQYLLGFMHSANLLEVVRHHPLRRFCVPAGQLEHYADKSISILGIPIARRVHRVMRSQEHMLFWTLQDESGVVDAVLWPDTFKRWHALTYEWGLIRVWGVVVEEDGSFILRVEGMEAVHWNLSHQYIQKPWGENRSVLGNEGVG